MNRYLSPIQLFNYSNTRSEDSDGNLSPEIGTVKSGIVIAFTITFCLALHSSFDSRNQEIVLDVTYAVKI